MKNNQQHMTCLSMMQRYRELLANRRKRKEYSFYMNGEQPSDGSPVKWTSCFNMYTVLFEREETDIWYTNAFHYIITMSIMDNIGLKIYEAKFTENDIVHMMLSMLCDLDTLLEFGDQDVSFIGANQNTSLERMIIGLTVDYSVITDYESVEFKESVHYSMEHDQLRDIFIEVRSYNTLQGQIQTVVKIPVSVDEIYEFVDTMLGIINDIELPSDSIDDMEVIMNELREYNPYQ